jgi:hypothetical protein
MESYIHYGVGPHSCLGGDASKVALTAMLRVIGRLDNLRPAPGPQGKLKKVERKNGFYTYTREDESSFYAFPMSQSHVPVSFLGIRNAKYLTYLQVGNCIMMARLPILRPVLMSPSFVMFRGIGGTRFLTPLFCQIC